MLHLYSISWHLPEQTLSFGYRSCKSLKKCGHRSCLESSKNYNFTFCNFLWHYFFFLFFYSFLQYLYLSNNKINVRQIHNQNSWPWYVYCPRPNSGAMYSSAVMNFVYTLHSINICCIFLNQTGEGCKEGFSAPDHNPFLHLLYEPKFC